MNNDEAAPPSDRPASPTAPPTGQQHGTPTPSAEAPSPQRRSGWRSWLIASVVTALVVVGAIVVLDRTGNATDTGASTSSNGTTDASGSTDGSGAMPGGFGGFGSGGSGEVTAVDGDTLTIETADADGQTRTMTVVTSADTVVSETVDSSVQDLAVGEQVVVVGESSGDEITAGSITLGGADGFGGPGGADGGFGGGRLPDGFEPPADGELPEGFEPPADGELPEGFEPPGDGGGRTGTNDVVSGEITSNDTGTLTLRTDDGTTVTVRTVDDVTVRRTETRSVADIEVGDTIRAIGQTDGDRIEATQIVIGESMFGPGDFGGPNRAPGGGTGGQG